MDLDRRLKEPNLVQQLDMEKAYDRVEWPFLLYMLRSFGFSEGTVDLFYRVLSANWFSVLVNGVPSGFFRSSRGVRQGDPLSPALFLLVAEYLGRGIQQVFAQNARWCYVSAGNPVPYLAFADDILIFTRCSQEGLVAVRDFLGLYQAMSGQKINVTKSSFLVSSRASEDHLAIIQSTLGYRQQVFPFVYLGAPIFRGKPTVMLFDGLLNKLRGRLHHWSSKLLSQGGKVVLLRHVLSTMPLYLLQVVNPPKAVLVAMGRICNSFLWDQNLDSQRIHWRAWEKLCYPVEEGGIGVRLFGDMLKAFSCKLWWRLRQKNSIWADFMHSKYIQELHPSVVSFARPSPIWRRLDEIRHFAESRICWSVGKGDVDFWYDRWLSEEPLIRDCQVVDPPSYLVKDLHSEGGWNLPILRKYLPAQVVARITQVRLYPEYEDFMVWTPSSSGYFSVASAWEALRQRRNSSFIDSRLWSSLVPLKISFFMWRLVRGLLPLDNILQRRGVCLPSLCVCCGLEQESLEHIFLNGPIAKEVWQHYTRLFGLLDLMSSSVSAMVCTWFLSVPGGAKDHVRILMPTLICWYLWKGRNAAKFQGTRFEAAGVIFKVEEMLHWMGRSKVFARDHFRGDLDCGWVGYARQSLSKVRYMSVAWEPPTDGFYKLNSDASVVNGMAYGGGLLRDSQGRFIFAFYKEFGEGDVLHAEGMSLLHGLRLCQQRQVHPVVAEVDSALLVHLALSSQIAKWPFCNILREIRFLLVSMDVSLRHVYREANSAADALASSTLGFDVLWTNLYDLPQELRCILSLDGRSFPFVRAVSVRE